MRLLILGGTLYLGRHTVEAARARGHAVTKVIGVTIPAAMTREREAGLHIAWRERGAGAGGERAMAGPRGGAVR